MIHGLRIARYRFVLTAASPVRLSAFIGSTLRGAFGGVFRRLVCVTRAPVCDGCLLRSQCAYGYLFETAPPADSEKLRNYQDIPRPFVFEPPCEVKTDYAPGEEISFRLLLIGRAVSCLPYFLFVFREMEKHGLGKGRGQGEGRFLLSRVFADASDGTEALLYDRASDALQDGPAPLTADDLLSLSPPLSGSRIRILFLTPARIRFEGHLLRDFRFHHLIRSLLRRLSGLIYFHCGGEMEADFRGLIEKARAVEKAEDSLSWQEQTRYSRRQQAELQMGGFVGSAVFEGDLSPFLPLLVAGEWTHVGKGCVMGLGRYQLR